MACITVYFENDLHYMPMTHGLHYMPMSLLHAHMFMASITCPYVHGLHYMPMSHGLCSMSHGSLFMPVCPWPGCPCPMASITVHVPWPPLCYWPVNYIQVVLSFMVEFSVSIPIIEYYTKPKFLYIYLYYLLTSVCTHIGQYVRGWIRNLDVH